MSTEGELERLRDRYLDLLRGALLHTIYRPIDTAPLPDHVIEAFRGTLRDAVAAGDQVSFDPVTLRETGRDSSVYAQTMAGVARLENVRWCIESVLDDEVPGDIIEAGVWRGGVSIFMRGVLAAHAVSGRKVVVADSFEGLPPPDPSRYPADADFDVAETGRFAIDRETVEQNFALYGLLDDQVEWVQGWFRDSLPALEQRRWAVIRLDGDLYESTIDALDNLYPQLSSGGFLIIDDWVLPPCRAAVEDYRRDHGITEDIVEIDWASAYWRRR